MKRLLKPVFSVAALAALAMPSTATAQSEELISNPRGMIANFDIPNLGPVLTELGIVWQRKVNDSGRGFIAASVGGQLSFNLVPTACQGVNDTNCIGLILVSLHGGNSVNTQTVSAFNQAVPFTSAGMLGNNAGAFLTRYEISDYGIPRGNVASSVYNFVGAATGFKEQLDTSSKTVSLDGFADDLSSTYLNRQSAETAGIELTETSKAKGVIHQVSFDETTEIIRSLMTSESAPRNKIRNISED